MVITIDGHAGSGKSTAARRLAAAIGFELLNTGAMYRAAALLLERHGVDYAARPRPSDQITAVVAPLRFDFRGGRVFLAGEDITDEIACEHLGLAASTVGGLVEVRRPLQAEQRRLAAGTNVVAEGRDQGTVVFPAAPCKFFFTATPADRARRRAAQLGLPADPATLADLAARIAARDRQDEARDLDPLARPAGAVEVDTSVLAADAVHALLLEVVRPCLT